MTRVLPFAFFALLILVLGVVILKGKDPSKVESALVGKLAPVFLLPGLSEKDLKGHVSVVNFFASWCVTCKVEQPVLARIAKDSQMRLYGIAYKDEPKKTSAWLKRFGNPYAKLGQDVDGRASIDWGVYGVPETFVVDAHGIVRYRHVGAVTPDDDKKIFQPLLRDLQK